MEPDYFKFEISKKKCPEIGFIMLYLFKMTNI